MPHQTGYVIDYYQHNGYLFNLEDGKRYVIVATTALPTPTGEKCKFMIRTIAPGLTLKHIE